MDIAGTLNQWWNHRVSQGAMLMAIAALLFLTLLRVPTEDQAVLGVLERLTFDLQMKFLRANFPRPAPIEPILIGIDESAEEAFDEPIAMWHKHFAALLDALAVSEPTLVGMDVVLPSRSFDHIRPGLDFSFLRSLANIKRNTPFVVVHTFDRTGKLFPIHPTFLKVLTDESFAIDKVLEDRDRVARRFNELETVGTGSLPAFSGHIARILGRKPETGFIDFSIGGVLNYVPMQQVIAWNAEGNVDELKRRFGGKVVLIGSVVGAQDRWQLPVALSEW